MLQPRLPYRPGETDLHLWRWDLNASASDFDRHWRTLSEEERNRAQKYRFEKHRRRFVVGRGQLRHILATYLECTAREIAFRYGHAGKPQSIMQPAQWRLSFNLSHSEDSAALGICDGFEIGVDVEHARPIEGEILPEMFSASERAQFDALPPVERRRAFFESWTKKEACLKALGTGLLMPPEHFEFELNCAQTSAPLRVGGDPIEARQWQVLSFAVSGGCAGAVAARQTGWALVPMPKKR
jgi:4'-phosphopantetheinyl transferase